jgi:hypothetical protein
MQMKKISTTVLYILFGLLLLTACSSADETAAPSVAASPQPAAMATALPTPFAPSDSIIWRDVQVTMIQSELTRDYVNEYGSKRIPSEGTKFLWVHVQLKNVGQKEIDTPKPEHFSALYATAEFKPTYGHRQGYADYTALGDILFPDQQVDAWLRFDVSNSAELRDLRFVFLPESVQVGVSFSSPNFPYAKNHPTYVWMCVP